MQPRKALGKGLASLIPSESISSQQTGEAVHVQMINIDEVIPNRLQPRHDFSEESLEELSKSIKQNGVIQPLIVTPPVSGRYELIAGERRLRASKLAGLQTVPVIIKEADTESMLELALIENLQREDLNPIEEAVAYKELMEAFDYTQEEVSEKVSKSRPHVANTLRLLYLPKVIQEDIVLRRLSPGHARALLAVSDLQEQLRMREVILHSKLTVRDVEKMIRDELNRDNEEKQGVRRRIELTPQMKMVVEEMTKVLGTKIKMSPARNNKGGKIEINYYSTQDLNRIYSKIVSD